MRVRRLLAAFAVLSGALAGCTAGPHPDDGAAPAAPFCPAPAVSESIIEVPATGGSVTGLLFGELPAVVGTDLKIVWRVTGQGPLTVWAIRPDGSAGELAFGPQPHVGSNFAAPGDEWGTGFSFDSAGCWRIELSRGGVEASLPVPVVPAGSRAGS